MYLGRPAYFSNGFVDLGMAEILRGPQGTLFGKNTVAGAFLLRSVRPEEEFGGYVDAMFGERDHQRYRAALNVPIFDTGLYSRGAFAQDKRDGYVYNRKLDRMEGDTGNTDYQFRLRYKPDNIVDLNLKVRYSDVDQKANGSSQIIFLSEFGRLSFEPFDPDIEDNIEDYETSMDHPGFVTRQTWDVIGEAEVNFWDHHWTFIGTHSEYDEYSETDVDFGPAPALIAYFPEQYNQQTVEFRVASEDDQTIEYIAGAYAFQSEIRAFTRVDAFPLNIPGVVVQEGAPPALQALLTGVFPNGQEFVTEQQLDWFDQDTFSWAVFGQVTWNVTDRLHLIGGLRYSYDQKKLTYIQEFTNTKIFFDQIAAFDEFELRGLERDEDDISPKASVIFDWTEEISAYATIAQGFKAGGYNESSATADEVEFQAEKSTTYEAGVKGRILGGFAQFSFGGFWTEFDDLQVSSYNGARFIVSNAAQAVTRGFEWEAGAILGEGLFVGFNGGYTEAFYRSFPNGECQINDERDTCDLSGNVLTNAPEWNGSAMAHYERPVTSGLTAFIGGDAIFVSKVFYQPDLDPIDTQGRLCSVQCPIGSERS